MRGVGGPEPGETRESWLERVRRRAAAAGTRLSAPFSGEVGGAKSDSSGSEGSDSAGEEDVYGGIPAAGEESMAEEETGEGRAWVGKTEGAEGLSGVLSEAGEGGKNGKQKGKAVVEEGGGSGVVTYSRVAAYMAGKKILTPKDDSLTIMDPEIQRLVDEGTGGDISLDDKDLRELFEKIAEVNGQDAFSNETAAIGRLNRNEFLLLPSDMVTPSIAARDVGGAAVHTRFTALYLASVYALNKERAPAGADKIKYALLRMEAVKMGWYSDQREVDFAPTPANAVRTLREDAAMIKAYIQTARDAAFLIPLAAEHVFRTFGHHYITANAAEYQAKYSATFKACLRPEVAQYLPADVLYHHSLHWVSPRRAWEVLQAQLDTDRIPEAIKVRATAAPAGVALVTTSAAVVNMMAASGIAQDIGRAGAIDLGKITGETEKIRADPVKYHKVPQAYGLRRLTGVDLGELEAARREAVKLAPIAQGFIDGLMKNAALGKAKALLKYSEENPILREKARRYFLQLGRARAASVMDLFAGVAGGGSASGPAASS